jgi:hypothetical protein
MADSTLQPPALQPPALQQRCWNHEAREAVCRCPECGRAFCHECVAEHESRLLCATCLAAVARTAHAQRSRWRSWAPAAMLLSGILLSWIFFYTAGQTISFFIERAEQSSWQTR